MGNLVICDHPLIQHKLTYIRDKDTKTKDFRELVDEVATLMAYEITREMPLDTIRVETPVAVAESKVLSGRMLGIVPILRAGLGMVDGILKLIPAAKVGHIGLSRDHDTLLPTEYYINLPTDATERLLIVVDPMLATGGSANAAIEALKKRGCTQLKLMVLIASPEGIRAVQEAHPEIDIYAAAVDEKLNEKGYIIPGLGDAGDRMFGTK
ncbi:MULTISPECIES: uracil phosphoribosyltransferase [Paenibacillus]|uniref:uracil phosphoribosyltransferase n=1 Tax=Paenibacillus TaxID=44249 RepID=UPI000420F3CB|nr:MULTISPECIES: uracil phosphoribosyltransferase [Paenibacillus]ASS67290.1 uracil phosphoribosyltransferase [Paenibacillus sp. RUD330]KKC48082.1 uracil phosphoribosyltransferase [Paenibacillus sp. D9]SIQ82547.1 uracil phosphoribosyltransferase [Paenibacillus sp. RU4X]SIR03882.1 uracil phosphoribosyltransferase [Paenibacillus sp. RU4T]